ncbi:peptidase M23B [Desulforamulus reducens MI-1]|uniref:Peptidase M23B n=1 Tax=Desulforamulus reducens (strain ATCC BAA-1160 / DSM 100696 / MI-1) TaxID=349161 RepID=A4J9P4_DESRM|nr:peptidoglycan DD-metalloendopeptidase family protein [Desulforamulus reducens]ABO51797.1 peptidase M23B [Desulforamulus reducens MI-1]
MEVKETITHLKSWFGKQPKAIRQGVAVFLVLALVVGGFSFANAQSACAVVVDGQVAAMAKDQAQAEQVIASLIKENQKKGSNVKPLQNITYQKTKKNGDIASEEVLKQRLSEKLTFEAIASGIKVNNGLKVAVKDKATAEKVLAELKKEYKVGPEFKVDFQEKVAVANVPVETSKILSMEDAIKRLKGENGVPRYHTVKEGETLWEIANKFNVSPEDLQAANPNFTPERMQIGQKIKMIGAADPLLNVVATAEKTVKEETALPQQVRKNAKLPFGQSRVVQKSERGLKEVTYKIVAVNGLETEREVLNVNIIKQAKPQIIERSAQTMVASRGYRPSGAIISPFGKRGGRMHTGVDLAKAYGSPVGAYNSGRVIRAGWYGAYGKCVDINHGNGIVTRYAHLSTINVSVGQNVERGQSIGNVGSTGRSTGPHLHFEVIVNGVPKNPVGYL